MASAAWRTKLQHTSLVHIRRNVVDSSVHKVSYKYTYQWHLLVVGTQMANNQQQLATQEFSTSQDFLYTHYLTVMCFYANK